MYSDRGKFIKTLAKEVSILWLYKFGIFGQLVFYNWSTYSVMYRLIDRLSSLPAPQTLACPNFYAPEIEDRGAFCFCAVCHSVWNFNLAYNFWMVCTRASIFHMSVPCGKTFPWVPNCLTMWPWPWCLTYLLKTLTLAITFKWYVLGRRYFTWVFLVTRSFNGYQNFDIVTLTLVFDLLVENFNLVYNIWMVSTRALIFRMSVPCDKTIPWVPTDLTLWPWPWYLTYLLACRDDCPESYCHDHGVGVGISVTPQWKNFNLGYIFWTIRDRMLIFHI
jgi:hypothetical protein